MGTLGYQLTNIPQAPDTSVYGKWLMQQGMSAGEVAQAQRAKRLDAERKADKEKADIEGAAKDAADAAYKASLLGIQGRQLDLQEKSAERMDAREQRLADAMEKQTQEGYNKDALAEAQKGGFANIVARDAEQPQVDETGAVITDASGTKPYVSPSAVQNWLGLVPFENLAPEQKQIVHGYGQQMGLGINEIPSAYETFRKDYAGALTPEEKQLQEQQKALRAEKAIAEIQKVKKDAALDKIVADSLVESDQTPPQANAPSTPTSEPDEVTIFGSQFGNDMAEINALRGKKPETVEVAPGLTAKMPTGKPSLGAIQAPGTPPPKSAQTPQQVRAFQPQEVVVLSTEMSKYPSRAEFMKANGIKTDAEYLALIKQIKALKAVPVIATTGN